MNNSCLARSPRPLRTPGVLDEGCLMHATINTSSREVDFSTRMETIRAFYEQENTVVVLTDQAISEVHLADEEHPMLLERMASMSRSTLKDVISGSTASIKDVPTASVTFKCDSKVGRTYKRLETVLQRPFNKTFDEKINFVEVESCFIHNIEGLLTSPRHVTRMT